MVQELTDSRFARRLRCSGLGPDQSICRADLFEAVDRPDRLELEIIGAGGSAAERSCAGLRPGSTADLFSGDRLLFAGRVERCGLRLGSGGWRARAVAWSSYESLRGRSAQETYFELTDSEIAERIAADLDLRAHVEPTREVHRRLERRGDPLRFLRRRARSIGYELAVAGGTLYFCREVPAVERAPLRIDPAGGWLALDVEERGAAGRGGALEMSAAFCLRPLLPLDLAGFGPAWDGRYRVVRARHHAGTPGARSRIEFLEQGTDFARWSGEAGA
ncbi:MAG: hypothetical protein JXA90_12570 [Planctomycetes bacterium]|nr:hypothetical protein [Planctomycetota bacterium]